MNGLILIGCCALVTGPLTGCPSTVSPGDGFGATQGGVQDMGLARELIGAGRVPPPEAFIVEGMFSEHDLGLTGEPCEHLLCLRTGLGVAPTLDGQTSAWLQVGLSSSIDMESYERPSLTIIATVDVSGSMGWEYTGDPTSVTPGEVSRNLLSAIATELDGEDQMAIVTYGSDVNTVLPLTAGDDQLTLQNAVDALSTAGSTNMEAGLVQAYLLARTAMGETDEVRVMLFTDVQPNVGATTATEFEQIVGEGADEGIGLTVFGVGVGLRQELFNAITHLRGGNAFTLFENEDVGELMDDDWPWLASPIAYDLVVDVPAGEGYFVPDAYGFPAGEDTDAAGFDVATVFLSRRKGALLVRFAPVEGDDLSALTVTGQLSYNTPTEELIEQQIDVTYAGLLLDADGRYYEQPNVGKTIALAILVTAMAEAAELYATDADQAIATLQAALVRFSSDASEDETLAPEVELCSDLLELMRQGAEQGDLYGSGVL